MPIPHRHQVLLAGVAVAAGLFVPAWSFHRLLPGLGVDRDQHAVLQAPDYASVAIGGAMIDGKNILARRGIGVALA